MNLDRLGPVMNTRCQEHKVSVITTFQTPCAHNVPDPMCTKDKINSR